jgi:hypothetical protein
MWSIRAVYSTLRRTFPIRNRFHVGTPRIRMSDLPSRQENNLAMDIMASGISLMAGRMPCHKVLSNDFLVRALEFFIE